MFQSDGYEPNSLAINEFITLFEVIGVVFSCFKQISSNLNIILELIILKSFGERIFFDV